MPPQPDVASLGDAAWSRGRVRQRAIDIRHVPPATHDVMRSFYSEYPPNILVPHTFLPLQLQVPDIDRKLVVASNTLRRAVGSSVVRSLCPRTHIMYDRLQQLHELVTDRGPSFHYYVTGGFVVSELLGFGEWEDIDVWTRPFQTTGRPGGFRVATGKATYPVKIVAVSDMESFIESCDLHICSCAILCCMLPDGSRGYELFMTRHCAVACKARAAHAWTIHPAVADIHRVFHRLWKYGHRDLRTPAAFDDTDLPVFGLERTNDDFALSLHMTSSSTPRGSIGQCQWTFEFRDEAISCIHLDFSARPQPGSDRPGCLPVVLYPCSHADDGANPDYRNAHSHWLVSLLGCAHHASLVAMRGGPRLSSASLLPMWLVLRMDLPRQEVERELLEKFKVHTRQDGVVIASIPCSLPVRLLRLMSNWNWGEATRRESTKILGGDTWCFFVDAPWLQTLPCLMFCRETLQVCWECDHGYFAALLAGGSTEDTARRVDVTSTHP